MTTSSYCCLIISVPRRAFVPCREWDLLLSVHAFDNKLEGMIYMHIHKYTVARSRCSFEQNVNFNLFSTPLPPPRECCTLCCLSISMFKHERIWNLRQLDDAVCIVNVNFTCWNFLLHIHESSAFLFALLLLPPPRELYCEFFYTALCISSSTIWERFSIFLMKYSTRRENIFSYSVDSWNIKNHQISLASVAEYEKFALESSTCCCYNTYNNLHFPSPRTRRTSNFFVRLLSTVV